MVQAARTTATPAEIWVIVVVAVGLLAFWLAAIMLADRSQARASGPYPMLGEAGSMPDDALTAASTPGGQDAGARGWPAEEEPVPEGDIPTRPDLPAQPSGQEAMAAQPGGRHAMPAQRSGDADRAERSYTSPTAPDEDDPGRR